MQRTAAQGCGFHEVASYAQSSEGNCLMKRDRTFAFPPAQTIESRSRARSAVAGMRKIRSLHRKPLCIQKASVHSWKTRVRSLSFADRLIVLKGRDRVSWSP